MKIEFNGNSLENTEAGIGDVLIRKAAGWSLTPDVYILAGFGGRLVALVNPTTGASWDGVVEISEHDDLCYDDLIEGAPLRMVLDLMGCDFRSGDVSWTLAKDAKLTIMEGN